jgi:hypothetical protein
MAMNSRDLLPNTPATELHATTEPAYRTAMHPSASGRPPQSSEAPSTSGASGSRYNIENINGGRPSPI